MQETGIRKKLAEESMTYAEKTYTNRLVKFLVQILKRTGWAKNVSLLMLALTLSTANQVGQL